MNFWAVAYQHQNNVFYDFESLNTTMNLSSTCLLPTKESAEGFIQDEFQGKNFVAVDVTLLSLNKDGVLTYSVGKVEPWEENLQYR